jgi:hypothetical protein
VVQKTRFAIEIDGPYVIVLQAIEAAGPALANEEKGYFNAALCGCA